jgi:peptidoglycan/LPS O-acetylase OafA/YrhL
VDGLRAVAVLCVVLYHAFPDILPGGFVGVDVFFVISGFLIGWVIMQDLDAGTFTLQDFYARRIRRIFPALAVLLLSVLLFGWFVLLEGEYASLGKHVLGGSAFVENILYQRELGGYFNAASSTKPLLHLWSLSIEEQFYILFPALLLLCRRNDIRIAAILVLGTISFAWNIHIHIVDRGADFYSPLARFWEILAGAALCALMRNPSTWPALSRADAALGRTRPGSGDGRRIGTVMAILGACLVAAGLALSRSSLPHPGWGGLLPVGGAALLIAAGPGNPLNGLILSNRVAVYIGRISYPLYLWHWAILSFAWIILGGPNATSALLKIALVAAALLLSVLTYHWVERPLRFGTRRRRDVVIRLAVSMAVLGLCGLGINLAGGLPGRYFIKEYNTLLQLSQSAQYIDEPGLAYAGLTRGVLLYCKYEDVGARDTVAVIGDSHAPVLHYGVAELGRRHGFNTVSMGWIVPDGKHWRPDIGYNADVIMDILERKKDIRKVFFISRGMMYITGMDDPIAGIPHQELVWGWAHPVGFEAFERSLQDYVDRLNAMGKRVYIISETPTLKADPRDYFARPLRPVRRHVFPPTMRDYVLAIQMPYLEILDRIRDATVIPTIPTMCPTKACIAFDGDGTPLYQDPSHLSIAGSRFLVEILLKRYILEP